MKADITDAILGLVAALDAFVDFTDEHTEDSPERAAVYAKAADSLTVLIKHAEEQLLEQVNELE